MEYRIRIIDTLHSRYKIQIWDCLSNYSYPVIHSMCKDASAILILFDLSDPKSIGRAATWKKETKSFSASNAVFYLVGTKLDLDRQITAEDGRKMAFKLGVKYCEISCKTNQNIEILFGRIINDINEVIDLKRTESASSSVNSSSKIKAHDVPQAFYSSDDSLTNRVENKSKGLRCCNIL